MPHPRRVLRGIGASDARTEPGIASAATEMAAPCIVLEPGMMIMFFEVRPPAMRYDPVWKSRLEMRFYRSIAFRLPRRARAGRVLFIRGSVSRLRFLD